MQGKKLNITNEQIEQVKMLASIGCTIPEIAVFLNCSEKTVDRKFVPLIKEGQERLKTSLRRFQFQSAQNGNVTMQIWLGKQFLSQKDENSQNGLKTEEIEQLRQIALAKMKEKE